MTPTLSSAQHQLIEACCRDVIAAARAALGEGLCGAMLKGSALKGDFFPGYSDIDIHLFAASRVMAGGRSPKRDTAFALQRQFGSADVLDMVEPQIDQRRPFTSFFTGILPWPPDADRCRMLLHHALDAAEAVQAHFHSPNPT